MRSVCTPSVRMVLIVLVHPSPSPLGSAAFTHKAGVHSKAVMQNPGSYEVIDPADFGIERNIQIAHRLTGWNAVQQRTIQLGYKLSGESQGLGIIAAFLTCFCAGACLRADAHLPCLI